MKTVNLKRLSKAIAGSSEKNLNKTWRQEECGSNPWGKGGGEGDRGSSEFRGDV